MLQLLSEEPIGEESVHGYFDDLYRIVCVAERPASADQGISAVRSTYVVDWEQLVHLLEDYNVFGEDIVEVTAIPPEEAGILRRSMAGPLAIARA